MKKIPYQRTPVSNDSTLPLATTVTNATLPFISLHDQDIPPIINFLRINKAHN